MSADGKKKERKKQTSLERGKSAARAMAEAIRQENARWNLPILIWQNDQVIPVNNPSLLLKTEH